MTPARELGQTYNSRARHTYGQGDTPSHTDLDTPGDSDVCPMKITNSSLMSVQMHVALSGESVCVLLREGGTRVGRLFL